MTYVSPTEVGEGINKGRTDHADAQNNNGGRTTMYISELAREAGVNMQTVRYYERRGLLLDPRRSGDGYREYTESSLERIRFIKRAQELGFTLGEIAELLALKLDPGAHASDVKARAEVKISEIEAKVRDLQRIRDALTHLAGRCRGGNGPTGDCPLLDAFGPLHSAEA